MFVRFAGVDMGCSITASADVKTGYWPFWFQLLWQSWSQPCLALALALIFELIPGQFGLGGSHSSRVKEPVKHIKLPVRLKEKHADNRGCLKFHSSRATDPIF